MTFNAKLVLTAGLSLAGVGVLWSVVATTDVAGRTLASAPETGPQAAAQVNVPAAVAEEPVESRQVLPTAEPEPAVPMLLAEPVPAPTTTDAEVWRDAKNAIIGMQDGSVTLEELVALTEQLLERLDAESARFDRDNSLVFDLLDDPDRGTATLNVNPGRVGEPAEFELHMSMPSAPGFGYPQDAHESELRVSFGVGEEGVDACSAFAQTSIKWEEDVNRRFMERGEVPAGGSLRIRPGGATWRPLLLRVVDDEKLGVAHQLRMGDEADVYAGVLSDPRLEPLAPRLRELRGRRPR